MDKVDSVFDSADQRSKGRRFLPCHSHNESQELLPSSAAMGHIMMTVGIGDNQFFWCDLCSAYTGERARKLARPCDRRPRDVPVVQKLRLGIHPHDGTQLAVRPRRMLIGDVGIVPDVDDGATCANTSEQSYTDLGGADYAMLTDIGALVLPSTTAFDNDQFSVGSVLGSQ